jgi:hypothetical protein
MSELPRILSISKEYRGPCDWGMQIEQPVRCREAISVSVSLGAAQSRLVIQWIVSPMIPITNASAAIQAAVHNKSSVFTLIVVNPKRRF